MTRGSELKKLKAFLNKDSISEEMKSSIKERIKVLEKRETVNK